MKNISHITTRFPRTWIWIGIFAVFYCLINVYCLSPILTNLTQKIETEEILPEQYALLEKQSEQLKGSELGKKLEAAIYTAKADKKITSKEFNFIEGQLATALHTDTKHF